MNKVHIWVLSSYVFLTGRFSYVVTCSYLKTEKLGNFIGQNGWSIHKEQWETDMQTANKYGVCVLLVLQ